jgi:Secretion system C-terminal sorting domain
MLNAQLYGKWVLSTTHTVGSNNHKAQLLEFSESGVSSTTLSTTAIGVGTANCELVNGAYNENYDFQYYFLSNQLIKDNYSILWPQVTPSSAEFSSESEVFPSIGESENHCIVYGQDGTTNSNGHVSLREITLNSSGFPIAIGGHTLVGEIDNSYMASFAITEEVNEARKLYLASCDGALYGDILNPKPYGLSEWTITETGITYDGELQEANSEIANQDFSAYNLEMKIDANNNEVIAWITNNSGSTDKIFIYEGTTTVHDLNKGRIGGIEFSPIDPDIIYVSCNDGIIAYNYQTGLVEGSPVVSGDYQRTFIQTAPDGHLYAASNYGANPGRINSVSGVFESNVLSFPTGFPLSNFRTFDGVKYYFLPENHRVFNYMTLSAETTDVCPGACNGSCTITVEGGFPEYTYQLFKEIEGIWTAQGDPQTPEEPEYIFTDLCEGEYKCEVTDSYNNVETIEFEIGVGDYFDVNGSEMELITTFTPAYWTEVNRSYESGFRIVAGVDVVITNSYLQFGKFGRVVIEPGASLTLINSTLNYYVDCDEKWRGVEVAGIDTQGQLDVYGDCQQGRLYMVGTGLNKSRIANAENGVSLYACTYSEENERSIIWGTAGGVVHAVNSEFVNNTKAVHFIPYQNVHPFSGKEIKNISSFELCSFDINPDYLDHTTFNKHIDLHGVNGIAFKGCSFTNTASNGISQSNIAIAAYGAGFEVESICSSGIDPCPQGAWTNSSFNGFYRAIAAYESSLYIYTFDIREAVFSNNAIGVFCSGVNDAVMIDNHFEIGHNPSDALVCDAAAGFGIDVQNALGFVIEENYFTKLATAEQGFYIGIRLTDTKSESDDIYRNEFVGLSIGNQAVGGNRSVPLQDQTGVAYQCNQNTGNELDFHVANESTIRGFMGTTTLPSGNTLTDPANIDIQFQNDYTQDIRYYYNINEVDEWLTKAGGQVYPEGKNALNACPTHYGGGGQIVLSAIQKQQMELEYAQALADYNSVDVLFNSLKDGGNTSAELADIQTASPNEMWLLRAKLLGDSPHLSQEVLKEMSDRTDVFPDATLLEILSANPEELRKEELISYLENKAQPLPDYMIDILEQVANGSSYKSVLQNQMADYHHTFVGAAQDIIRSIQHDSISDLAEIRIWLDNIGGYEMDKRIITTYLQEGDFISAQNLLNLLPVIYDLTGDELQSYNEYKTITELYSNLAQQNRNVYQLTASELVIINEVASNGLGSAKYSARCILEFAENQHYFDCPQLPESVGMKTFGQINPNQWSEAMGLVLGIEPNPANSWVTFDYQLPVTSSEGMLTISDVEGRLINEIQLSGLQGQYIWDSRNVKPGLYICIFKSGEHSYTGKLIVR